jgi:hypothetical protein
VFAEEMRPGVLIRWQPVRAVGKNTGVPERGRVGFPRDLDLVAQGNFHRIRPRD